MSLVISDLPSLSGPAMQAISKLTQKDRLLILASKDATLPVSLFASLSSLKVPVEFITELEDEKDLFSLGFLCGVHAFGAKPGENVQFFLSGVSKSSIPVRQDKAPRTHKAPKRAEGGNPSPTAQKSSPAPSAVPAPPAEDFMSKPVEFPAEKPAHRPKGSHDTASLVQKTFADQNYSEETLGQIVTAIEQASDREIGLPFTIKLNSGIDMQGDLLERAKKIFDQTHK